jgi:hypothetical protein
VNSRLAFFMVFSLVESLAWAAWVESRLVCLVEQTESKNFERF